MDLLKNMHKNYHETSFLFPFVACTLKVFKKYVGCLYSLILAQSRLRAVSLFSWSVEQNARDTQMTTRVTEDGLSPSFLASRDFAAQRSRARALPLQNLKKKRHCSLSRLNLERQY